MHDKNRRIAAPQGRCSVLRRKTLLAGGMAAILAASVRGDTVSETRDFSSLSLQELSLIKVTSVSKTQQVLSQVAAAVYVISQKEIRRSGMTNLADLLRLVPGLSVARLGSSQWAVTSRGFNGRFANKLLVMIDGRSIYTPIFSGVYWDMCMPLLEDIERIEVIRGPGASVWGANAVNGVINIITKDAGAVKGTTVTAGAGNAVRGFGELRFGGKMTDRIAYRGYVSGYDRSALKTPDGQDARDGWSNEQAGFRIDGTTRNGSWHLEGDLFRSQRSEVSDLFVDPSADQGLRYANVAGNASDLTFEWRQQITEKSDIRFNAYYDFMNRPEVGITKEETRTGDFELQYHFTASKYHEISVGVAERLISETVIADGPVWFTPPGVSYQLASGFAQDEIHFLDDRLLATSGVKIEHSMFGGWQVQPTERLLWAPNKRHSAWISISRAARTPAFYERNFTAETGPATMSPLGNPMIVTVNGSPLFRPEILQGYEIGYRAQPTPRFSVDVAAFLNNYTGLASQAPAPPRVVVGASASDAARYPPTPYLLLQSFFANAQDASAIGGELSSMYQPRSWWKLAASYGYLNVQQGLRSGAPPAAWILYRTDTPRNQWKLQSYLNLSRSVQFDTLVFSTGSIQNRDAAYLQISPHTRLDVRLGWRVSPRFEISLSGQDLLSDHHTELTPEAFSPPADAIRAYYLKTIWRF